MASAQFSRRSFLQSTAAGTAGLALSFAGATRAFAAAGAVASSDADRTQKSPAWRGFSQCAREDSNLHELSAHKALNLARLPIPPQAQRRRV